MVVVVLERVAAALRGELSRWMLEIRPGVFVGNVSSLVRDKLWDELVQKLHGGCAIVAYTTNNEQGFEVRVAGEPAREIADFDGLLLVRERKG